MCDSCDHATTGAVGELRACALVGNSKWGLLLEDTGTTARVDPRTLALSHGNTFGTIGNRSGGRVFGARTAAE